MLSTRQAQGYRVVTGRVVPFHSTAALRHQAKRCPPLASSRCLHLSREPMWDGSGRERERRKSSQSDEGRRAVVPPQERELDMQDTKIRWRLGGRGENTLM